MADKRIDELNIATAVQDSDMFALEQNGEAKQLKGSTLRAYAESAGNSGAQPAIAQAQTAASTATTKASEAASSANSASGSATNASKSASNAASSASAAATSASTATNKANEAASSASTASSKAGEASTYASNAASSASAAAASKTGADNAKAAIEAMTAVAVDNGFNPPEVVKTVDPNTGVVTLTFKLKQGAMTALTDDTTGTVFTLGVDNGLLYIQEVE